MEVFILTLNQMAMMFLLILAGAFLRKKKIVPENTGTTLAKLETYIFCPALNLYNMITRCTAKTFAENSSLIFAGLAVILAAVLLAYPLSRLFVRKVDTEEKLYQRNIYKYAMAFGNYGFMGNFIILGIWGFDVYFKYSLFCFFVTLFCTVWGLFILIPKDKAGSVWANLKKGLLTPPTISLVIGMILGLSGISQYVPDFAVRALESASYCQGPVAMLLAGVIIGGYNFRELISKKKVYLASLMRLIVIPAVFLIVLKAIGVEEEILIFTLVVLATPLGLNTIVYPAAYGGDTKTGASMATISNTFAIATLPLMYLLFIELL